MQVSGGGIAIELEERIRKADKKNKAKAKKAKKGCKGPDLCRIGEDEVCKGDVCWCR